MQDTQNDNTSQRMDEIEKTGSIITNGKNGKIYCLTIIGQIEGHFLLEGNAKSTKYEHIIPLLVSVEEDDDINGLLVILNTVGGDVEAGLAIAELIASMKKPSDTASALGYVFGIHDQYRDYYYDAESFDMNNAIENEDGSHPFCDVWDGGSHTMLCQSLSPEYVKRNYKNFENLGINIEGAYLDVFGVVPLDECFNPEHRMTRKECCEKRLECFNILTSKGIIPSSEEAVDCMMKGIALCHHAPYFAFLDKEHDKPTPFGIPVPLFNLVWHESLIIPWTKIFKTDFDRWKGIPYTDTPYLHALLNGDTIYLPIEPNEDEIDVCNKVLELHKRVALEEMVEHRFLDDSYRVQQTVFSDGTKVTVNFDTDEYKISME